MALSSNVRAREVAVDPVFGKPIAGAGLIRLGYAGSSHPDDLRSMLAQARFTLLDSLEAP